MLYRAKSYHRSLFALMLHYRKTIFNEVLLFEFTRREFQSMSCNQVVLMLFEQEVLERRDSYYFGVCPGSRQKTDSPILANT